MIMRVKDDSKKHKEILTIVGFYSCLDPYFKPQPENSLEFYTFVTQGELGFAICISVIL